MLPAGKVHWDDKQQEDVVEKTIKIEGKLTCLDYETPDNLGGLEVLDNYEQGLKAAGFNILFSCYAKECGDGYLLDRDQFGDDLSQVGGVSKPAT